MPTEQEIAAFVALKNHAEKVAYFAAHPKLARVFNSTMFSPDTVPPEPEKVANVVSTPSTIS